MRPLPGPNACMSKWLRSRVLPVTTRPRNSCGATPPPPGKAPISPRCSKEEPESSGSAASQRADACCGGGRPTLSTTLAAATTTMPRGGTPAPDTGGCAAGLRAGTRCRGGHGCAMMPGSASRLLLLLLQALQERRPSRLAQPHSSRLGPGLPLLSSTGVLLLGVVPHKGGGSAGHGGTASRSGKRGRQCNPLGSRARWAPALALPSLGQKPDDLRDDVVQAYAQRPSPSTSRLG